VKRRPDSVVSADSELSTPKPQQRRAVQQCGRKQNPPLTCRGYGYVSKSVRGLHGYRQLFGEVSSGSFGHLEEAMMKAIVRSKYLLIACGIAEEAECGTPYAVAPAGSLR
jgi:hypothetical protein